MAKEKRKTKFIEVLFAELGQINFYQRMLEKRMTMSLFRSLFENMWITLNLLVLILRKVLLLVLSKQRLKSHTIRLLE